MFDAVCIHLLAREFLLEYFGVRWISLTLTGNGFLSAKKSDL